MLIHTFIDKSYFFEWAFASGNLDKIRLVLSELRNKLDELNRRNPDNSLLPSYEYQIAIENIEFDCEKLANFLMCHESIDSVLFNHLYFLEQINTEFQEHFINKLLPLKTILLQSTIHGSAFGEWVSKSNFYNFIRIISSDLKKYFSQIDSLYNQTKLTHYPFMLEFIDAIRNMDHNPILFQNFIKNHPTVILLFIQHIGILEDTNKAFQHYLEKEQSEEKEEQSLVERSEWIEKLDSYSSLGSDALFLDIDQSKDINYLELVKELCDFYSEDLQPSHKTKSRTEYTEEEKKESLARLNDLGSNIRDILKKDMQPLHESPTQFNLAFRNIKSIYKETAMAIKKSKGDTQTIVNCLEELNSFLTSFLDIQQQPDTPPEFKYYLTTKISWVKTTLDRLRSNIPHFEKIEPGKGKGEAEIELLIDDFKRKLTVSPVLATQPLTQTKEASKEEAFFMDYSKWIEKLNTFNSSDSAQNIFKKTAVELQKSDGDPKTALIALERLEKYIILKQHVTRPESIKLLDAKLSWTRKKVKLLQLIISKLEKTEEEQKQLYVNYAEWIQILNDFSNQYTSMSSQSGVLNLFNLKHPDQIQRIFKKASSELQESNGDIMKIFDILELLESNLQLSIISGLYRPIEEHLKKYACWVNETLKELNLQIKVYKALNKPI